MKPFNKIRQQIDKAFVRPDKTEVLSEDLLKAEMRIELIKQTCESTIKKVTGCLQNQGKEGLALDKRVKQMPEVILGLNMVDNGNQLINSVDVSVLGEVLHEAGKLEMKLGNETVAFEVKIEQWILTPLLKIINIDLPNIYKLKRTLSKLTSDMDSTKAKYLQASNRHSISTHGKIDNIKDEMEDSQQKVEQCRDNLAAEMYQLIARELEISKYVLKFLQLQREYHNTISSILDELIPGVESLLENSNKKPVFGLPLDAHLQATQRTLAYPIELCVCGLLTIGLEEEGLFRIAGSSSKVKKLKSAFDARLIDLNGLLKETCDPHVIGNALKCYLRELPEPLLTFALYDDWITAVRVQDSQDRLQCLWKVVQKLPSGFQDNLRYLIKFLKVLSDHQDVNKMSPANIAIVIGPNLLWQQSTTDELTGDATPMGLNMTMTHLYSSIVDQLVTYSDYFFPGEIDFYVTCSKPDLEALKNNSMVNGIEEVLHEQEPSDIKRSQSNSSIDDISPPQGSPKPVLRRKNKPAPVPPSPSVASKGTSPAQAESPSNKSSSSAPPKGSPIEKSHSFLRKKEDKAEKASKRDAFISIPPSPNQGNRKSMNPQGSTGSGEKVAPPKPPQPSFSQDPSWKKPGNDPPPKPATPLKYQSSFKAGNSVDSPDAQTTPTNQFSSLPRHFSTENFHKRAPIRPPSMYSPPQSHFPELLPKVKTEEQGNVVKEQIKEEVSSRGITLVDCEKMAAPCKELGFEKVEIELRSSSDVGGDNSESTRPSIEKTSQATEKTEPQRPIPAPRSSLLAKEVNKEVPVMRDRPSLMAKPRDLARKSHGSFPGLDNKERGSSEGSGGSGADSDNQDSKESRETIKRDSESDENLDEEAKRLQKNEGSKDGYLAPQSPRAPFRPPRPQPPPPPTKIRSLHESTDF